jgi:hypothetical protein
MAMQQIEVTFNDDGTANIKLPEGKSMRVSDPAKVAALTENLAKALGPILERHAAHSHIMLTDKGFVKEEHLHEGQ